MKFYCQLDYKHIPYVSPTSLNGNIADNGCGVCCASMIIEDIKGIDFPPEVCAIFSKQSGAREGFGTDMRILAPAISKEFDIPVVSTLDTNKVISLVQYCYSSLPQPRLKCIANSTMLTYDSHLSTSVRCHY